jgi:voltage-gated sodium channel
MVRAFLVNERRVIWLIVLNAIVLFALGFSQIPAEAARLLALADDAITLVFVLEIVAKTQAYGWHGYIRSNWNKFDLALVLVSLPSLTSLFVDLRGLDLSYLLVLRVCRVFKFFRLLRFVPGIDQMLRGVARALRASVMLLLGFFVGLFMVSLLSTKLFGGISPEHFGDPLRSLYSTFKIFTVEGWFEIPDDVTGKLDGAAAFFARLYFSLLVLGAGIMGLSIVNSVFVDAMVADNNADLESKVDALRDEIKKLREDLRSQGS